MIMSGVTSIYFFVIFKWLYIILHLIFITEYIMSNWTGFLNIAVVSLELINISKCDACQYTFPRRAK